MHLDVDAWATHVTCDMSRFVAAALAEFAEVAPVGRLSGCGVIAACAFLLSTVEFRTEACELLRRIAARKQTQVTRDFFSDS